MGLAVLDSMLGPTIPSAAEADSPVLGLMCHTLEDPSTISTYPPGIAIDHIHVMVSNICEVSAVAICMLAFKQAPINLRFDLLNTWSCG